MAPRFFYKKGHGAAPFYFSLDKTLGQLEPNFFFIFFFIFSTAKYINTE
jgi:hypothetical protein